MTLSPSLALLTPQDRQVSIVDPFEALRAYAKRDESRLGGISGCTKRNPLLDTDTIRHVAHATTDTAMGECDITLRAFAPGSLQYGFVQELPSSNSPQASCEISNTSTSGSSLNHRRDTEQPQCESFQTNATRYSSDDKQLHSHAREFHIQLAATNLERERGTVRVPANMDLDYIRFREELKQKLMRKGDECIWRGLVAQDERRL